MSQSSNNQKPQEFSSKKSIHPIIWLSLGVVILWALQTWVFPKVGFPS